MIRRVSIHSFQDNKKAAVWAQKIVAWTAKHFPRVQFTKLNPEAVIVLGGDGTILHAVQTYSAKSPVFVGLNLGHIGFLASSRKPKNFFVALGKLFGGKYRTVKRMMIKASVVRAGKEIFSCTAMNEVVIQSLLGLVHVEARIEHHPIQYVRGSGIMVATATGSTAYNLSAHGPVIMPDIKCMILTEIMDHNIPTPSIVVKRNREITLRVLGFRKRNLLKIAHTGEYANVILSADTADKIFPLEIGDTVHISRFSKLVKFAEFEDAYFFKSLREKFAFR